MAPQTGLGVDQLVSRLDGLEARVKQLEERVGSPGAQPVLADSVSAAALQQQGAAAAAAAGPQLTPEIQLNEAGSLVPLFAKALIALGGGYLLRALTTSQLAPPLLGVILAFLYAAFWMVLATRYVERDRLAGAVYMAISVLSLSPMLWETTVVLQLLAPWTTALALTAFTAACLLLSWKHHLEATAWLGAVAGAVVALALCAGTHDLVPFCASLLATAAILEIASARGFWLGPRRIVALVADLGVLWLIYIYGRTTLPEGYTAFPVFLGWAMPAGLLLLYVGGTAFRTLILHIDVMPFEVFQLLAGFGLLVFAATRRDTSLVIPGAVLLVCGIACYLVAFGRLIHESHIRNLQVYSLLGFALVVLACLLAMPPMAMAAVCAISSVMLAYLSSRLASSILTAAMHSLAFLIAATMSSGLAASSFALLLRDGTQIAPAGPVGAIAAAAAMAAGALLLPRTLTRLAAVIMLSWILAASVAALLMPAAPDLAWRAVIRTFILIAAALTIAFLARLREHPEWYWIPVGAMLIALARMAMQDLPDGRPVTVFLALLAYGGGLLALSRMMRGWRPLNS